MVIRQAIEIFREDTSTEEFKKEIELLKNGGFMICNEYDDYVCVYKTATVVNSDLIINKNI